MKLISARQRCREVRKKQRKQTYEGAQKQVYGGAKRPEQVRMYAAKTDDSDWRSYGGLAKPAEDMEEVYEGQGGPAGCMWRQLL